jgi:hypothetical protein
MPLQLRLVEEKLAEKDTRSRELEKQVFFQISWIQNCSFYFFLDTMIVSFSTIWVHILH